MQQVSEIAAFINDLIVDGQNDPWLICHTTTEHFELGEGVHKIRFPTWLSEMVEKQLRDKGIQ